MSQVTEEIATDSKPIKLSFDNFQSGWVNDELNPPPKNFALYMGIDPSAYDEQVEKNLVKNKEKSIYELIGEIGERADTKYKKKLMPLVCFTVAYSAEVFPMFNSAIYPSLIMNDWLAMAGWMKFQRDHLIHQPLSAYTVLALLRGWKIEQNSSERTHENVFSEDPLRINDISLLDRCIEIIKVRPEMRYFRSYCEDSFGWERGEFCENMPDYLLELIFVETAFVAAMFHDIGYAWQHVSDLSNTLTGANSSLNLVGMHNSETLQKALRNRLLFRVLNGYRATEINNPMYYDNEIQSRIEDGVQQTHGLPGALLFLQMNDLIRDFPREEMTYHPFRRLVIEWAAVAICMHDFSKIYRGRNKNGESRKATEWPGRQDLRLRAERDPLSCVLALADLLQDFERSHIVYSKMNENKLNFPTIEFVRECESVEISTQDDNLIICFNMDSNIAVSNKKHYFLKKNGEWDQLFGQYGYIDLSAFGINHIDFKFQKKSES